MKRLTKKIMQQYGIEIGSQIIDSIALPKPRTLYTITVNTTSLKINWSGIGEQWLQKAKKELLAIINI